jgi:hypothetical protein
MNYRLIEFSLGGSIDTAIRQLKNEGVKCAG